MASASITDFLKRDIPPEKLAATLEVVREFKDCETLKEWLDIPFAAWVKIEQLVEFLEHRVEGKPLADDTIREIAKHAAEE